MLSRPADVYLKPANAGIMMDVPCDWSVMSSQSSSPLNKTGKSDESHFQCSAQVSLLSDQRVQSETLAGLTVLPRLTANEQGSADPPVRKGTTALSERAGFWATSWKVRGMAPRVRRQESPGTLRVQPSQPIAFVSVEVWKELLGEPSDPVPPPVHEESQSV